MSEGRMLIRKGIAANQPVELLARTLSQALNSVVIFSDVETACGV